MEETIKKEKVGFGWQHLFKPTPEAAKIVFRTVLYTAAIVVLALKTFHGIPETFKNEVNAYALEVVAFVHLITKFFGVKNEEIDI